MHSEQVLHLWLETLCSCVEVVEKWYQPWSFMRSPGWVQIKCELRLALPSQLCFCVVSSVACSFIAIICDVFSFLYFVRFFSVLFAVLY